MKRIDHSQLCLLLLLSLAMAGCGGGNNTSTTTAIPFFSGAYQINATSNTNSATIWRLNGNLAQNGRSVSGIMHITMPSCFSFSTDIPVTGSLSDAPDFPVELGLTLPSGQILNFSLSHPAVHPSLLDGTYSITGAGCAGPASGGAIVNTLVLTGAWRATFTSTGGTASQMSMALTQTGPDAHGFFSGTGTATITGGTCFSAATVDPASLLIGAGSQLILDNSQPGTTGKTILQGDFAPLAFGGDFFTGTYTSTQGTCSESGTVSMQFP